MEGAEQVAMTVGGVGLDHVGVAEGWRGAWGVDDPSEVLEFEVQEFEVLEPEVLKEAVEPARRAVGPFSGSEQEAAGQLRQL